MRFQGFGLGVGSSGFEVSMLRLSFNHGSWDLCSRCLGFGGIRDPNSPEP